MTFKPTLEQEAVIEATRATSDSLMLSAYAGCAKTSTMELAAQQVKVPAIALAFNKKIAVEMQRRLPGNFQAKTMNGLGHGAWARANSQVQTMKIEEKKLGKLVSQVAKDRKVDLSADNWDQLRRMVTVAMQAGIVPVGSGPEGFLPDTRDSWQAVADAMMMFPDDFNLLVDLAHEVLEKDIALARAGIISFDDQVYCPTLLGGRFPLYPFVAVDEAQDLSPLNHAMLAQCVRPDGRLFAVGDEKQAIYAFRGASGDSMQRIRRLRDSWTDLPLATTFRCPKTIVARQLDHAPGFNAWHTNAEGRFASWRKPEEAKEWNGWTYTALETMLPAPTAEIAILCRNNGPLLSMAFKLIRRGVGVVMLGRDIGKGLVLLSKKLCPEDGTPADQIRGKIEDWKEREVSLALANGKEEKVAGITDRAECLHAVLDSGGARDAGELRQMLEKLFSRESGMITLSSIHRAKGLEWDVVLHLDPWRLPSRWAKESAKAGDPIPLRQEWNLKYVAETRTKHTLINANLEDFQ